MTHHRGFTLLELLIGMTLLGIMLVLLLGAFKLANDSWDAVDSRTSRSTDEELARALLRRLITQIQPIRWTKPATQPMAFMGDRTALRAVAPLAGQAATLGLRVFEIRQEVAPDAGSGAGSMRLVLRHGPVRRDADSPFDSLATAKSSILLDGLSTVTFDYFGAPRQGEPAQWQEAWDNSERLPQLVRIHIGSPDPGWTDLVVAPLIGGTGCRWDNFHKRCR